MQVSKKLIHTYCPNLAKHFVIFVLNKNPISPFYKVFP